MVALRLEEDLGLVLEAAKALAVYDAVYIPLEAGAHLALRLRPEPAGAVAREDAPGADKQLLSPLSGLSWAAHGLTSFAPFFSYTILILSVSQNPFIFPKKFSAA